MNVLLYLITSTQLLLLFFNGRTGSHMMMMMMMFFWHKYYYTVTISLGGGGQLIRKRSPLTTHSPATLCCASLVGPSIPTYLGGSTLPFYLQVSDLSRCVLFRLPRRVIIIIIIAVVVSAISLQREKASERERQGEESQVVNNVDSLEIFLPRVFFWSRDQSGTTFYQD